MREKDLLKIVYKFYPKDLTYFNANNKVNKKYLESKEYRRLIELVNKSKAKPSEEIAYLIKQYNNEGYYINDISALSLGDRAFTIQFSKYEGDRLYAICFTFSIIIPVYTYYIYEVLVDIETKKWIKILGTKNEIINKNKFRFEIFEISEMISKKTNSKPFPKEIISKTIYNINYNDIPFKKFTFFNAYFMNQPFAIG